MGQVCLISGPPGCGKTTWALQRLQQHQGPCAYLRLEGEKPTPLLIACSSCLSGTTFTRDSPA